MRIIVRILWSFSFLGFIFNLFTTYGNLQQVVGIQVGAFVLNLSRSQYFFFFLGFFIVINSILYSYSTLVLKAPKQLLIIPNREFWTQDFNHRKMANSILSNWMWAIAATLNYFLMFWMLVVESQFHFEGSTISSISWFYIPGVFMAITLIFPFIRLLIRKVNLVERERE